MNTNHPEIETISAFLDGEVSERERTEVERHLSSCTSCSATTTRLKQAADGLASLGPVLMTADEHRALRQTLLGAHNASAPGRWSFGRLQGALAGGLALLLVAVVGFAFMRSIPNADENGALTEAAAPAEVSGGPITIDSDEQIQGTVLALPEVRQRDAARNSLRMEADPEPPGQAATQDNAASKAAPPAESFASEPGGEESGEDSAAGAYAGATNGDAGFLRFSPEAGAACSNALASALGADLESIVVREVAYQGDPAWLLVFEVPSSNLLRTFIVAPEDCSNRTGEALTSSILSSNEFLFR